ncbi:hypothetical protein WA158_008380 [Blastocystis sp. Blastoise]
MFKRKDKKPLTGMGGGSRAKETKAEKEAKQKQKTLAASKKKGDVNELQTLLSKPEIQKDDMKLREVMRKVIYFTTMGVDMSKLFPNVVMVSITKDIVVKKMTNQYLVTYAKQNEDLAILAINTFDKDSRNENPTIRGMALRSLCSLRLISVVEYMRTPLERGLQDKSAYVRRTAIMGVLKLYHLDKELVKNSNLITALQNLVLDTDPLVVTNALLALKEITGDLPKTQALIHHLLNRLKDFNEWCMCTVLDLVSQYCPENEQELFGIMNLLEPFLRYHNTAVVLATTKTYLAFTENMPQVKQQVFTRLKQPLLTLIASPYYEVSYTVLSHVKLMLRSDNSAFVDEYRQFFCRYTEPSYIWKQKIEILPLLATDKNYMELLGELKEYVPGSPEHTAREAIRAIANLGINMEIACRPVFDTLIEFLDIEVEHIRSETVVVLQDLLRKHPEYAEEVMSNIPRLLTKMTDPKGRAACLWLIGAFPDMVEDAPYVVEIIIDGITEEKAICVRLELLTCCIKLFFRRAPEMQAMLGRLFKALIEDESSPDLRDRVLMYYRLLKNDVESARSVIDVNQDNVDKFVDMEESLIKTLFEEFNSLSVIYEKPAANFVTTKELVVPDLGYNGAEGEDEDEEDYEEGGDDDNVDDDDMFQEDDMASGNMMGNNAPEAFALEPNSVLDRAVFQQKWTTLTAAHEEQFQIANAPSQPNQVEAACSANAISFVASGFMGQVMKIFLFGCSNGMYFLTELLIAQNNCKITVKSEDPSNTDNFVQILKNALNTIA